MGSEFPILSSGPLRSTMVLAPFVPAEELAAMSFDGTPPPSTVLPLRSAVPTQASLALAGLLSKADKSRRDPGLRLAAASPSLLRASARGGGAQLQAQASMDTVLFLNTTESPITSLTIGGQAQAPIPAGSPGQPGGPLTVGRNLLASSPSVVVTFETGLTWTLQLGIPAAVPPNIFEVWIFWNGCVLANQSGVMLLLAWT